MTMMIVIKMSFKVLGFQGFKVTNCDQDDNQDDENKT